MNLSLFMRYEINITYKCNLKCPYCSMKQRLNENISEQEVLSLLENVESGSEVTLSGGEPGLCERKFIFKIFRILLEKNTKIKVNTNGLFIKKYRHLLKFVDTVNFHIETTTFKKLPFKKINYVIILTRLNVKTLKKFLSETYSKFKVKFDIIPCTDFQNRSTNYTSKVNLIRFSKFMTKESLRFFLNNNRYRVTYLN